MQNQIKKARGTWARVGQVLQADNTPPKVSAMFYKVVVQSVLLYGSETWNLTKTALVRLEGFHIRAAYRMAKKHKPRREPNQVWVYPATKDVLKECGMHSIAIAHYIGIRRETIFQYVVDRPIYTSCTKGERRRGSAPRQWWWEQKMVWTTKTQTELSNRGTLVGWIDGIRSAHLCGSVSFTWNARRTIGFLTGGGFAAPLWQLR